MAATGTGKSASPAAEVAMAGTEKSASPAAAAAMAAGKSASPAAAATAPTGVSSSPAAAAAMASGVSSSPAAAATMASASGKSASPAAAEAHGSAGGAADTVAAKHEPAESAYDGGGGSSRTCKTCDKVVKISPGVFPNNGWHCQDCVNSWNRLRRVAVVKGLQGHLARMKRGNFDKARQLMDECFQSLSTNKEFDIGARMWELSNGLFGTLPGAAPAAVPAVSLDVAAPSPPTGAAPALAAAAVVAQPPLMPTGLVDEEIVIRCKKQLSSPQ